jgi:hypothetical protein
MIVYLQDELRRDVVSEKWYDDLPEDFFERNADEAYKKAFEKIREGLDKGLGFDEAVSGIEVRDGDLRKRIIDDMLKVILAEKHFAKNIPLDELAQKLKVSVERLEAAKQRMFSSVPIKSFKVKFPGSGNT